MSGETHPFRFKEQIEPPPARQVTDVTVMRFDGIYEVDPRLMQRHIAQQLFPNWDTLRIAEGREDHLEWMHQHWCATVVSGQEILDQLEREEGR